MTTKQEVSDLKIDELVWARAELYLRNEVFLCLSGVVAEMAKAEGFLDDFPELLQGQPSWGEWTCTNDACQNTWEAEPRPDMALGFTQFGLSCPSCGKHPKAEDFEAEDYQEIYEHWAVSQWLHDQLKAKGEAVCDDFYGLCVWGRTTTGQAVYADSVIQQIAKENL